MKKIGIILITIFALGSFTSCETEEEKAMKKLQEEARKIVLSQEEFATFKEYSKNSYNTISIDESKIVEDDKVEGDQACEQLTLDDLLELYHIGKKRDWLLEHGFEINYYLGLFQNKKMKYEDIKNSHFIGYGRCYYKNAVRKRRIGLRLTHIRHQKVEYQTTFKSNSEEIEVELKSKGAKELEDGSYVYEGIPIYFDERKGNKGDLLTYLVVFNSTYTFNPMEEVTLRELKELEELLKQQPK